MQLSVIVLNYKVPFFLKLCLDSVFSAIQNIDAEVIVVDNHSEDESCTMVKKDFPNAILIENKENFGFPKGNNIGVTIAKGKYICILNPDTVVAENTFEILLNHIKTLTDFGILGCKLIDGSGRFLPESKRGVPSPWIAFTKFFNLYKFFSKNKLFNQYYASHVGENEHGDVDILVGAFMLMERELYENLKGFDENCFMYADDIDLSYRAILKGKKNYYNGKVTAIHYKGESTNKDVTYMKRFSEAMNFFYTKHFKKSIIFDVLMKIGIFVFSYLKKQKGKKPFPKIENYYLVSNNEDFDQFKKIPNLLIKNSLVNIPFKKNSELIFDANYTTYQAIINSFDIYKNQFTFKILPKNSNFIIGSYSSEDRGEVVELKIKN
jgi:GT2 family glycosyltransferase